LSTERNSLPDGKHIFALDLTFEVKLEEKSKVQMHLPPLTDLLYESPYDSQMIMVFDQNKQLLGVSDAWPKNYEVTLGKGSFHVRCRIRHEDMGQLEKVKSSIVLTMIRPLSKSLSPSCYRTRGDALTRSRAFSEAELIQGSSTPLFFTTLDLDAKAMPKGSKPGDILKGKLSLAKSQTDMEGVDARPSGFPLTLVMGPAKVDLKSAEAIAAEKSKKTAVEDAVKLHKGKVSLSDSIRDAKIAYLRTNLKGKDSKRKKENSTEKDNAKDTVYIADLGDSVDITFDSLYAELLAAHPCHLPLLEVGLDHFKLLNKEAQKSTSQDKEQ
jgi:tripeptidyl-peptidase-2